MKTGKHLYRKSYVDRQGVTQISPNWFMRFWHNGKEHNRSTGESDRKKAEGIYLAELARMASFGEDSENQAQVTIGQLLRLVIDDYRLQGRRTVYNKSREVAAIADRIGTQKAAQFGTKAIKAYIATRSKEPLWSTAATKEWKSQRDKKLQPATINRELATLRRAFKLGLEHDPPLVARVPKFPMLKEENVREGVLAHDQYICLRTELPPHARLALVIAYHTGARRGEILSIEKPHIDLKALRILMPGRSTKNGKPKYIPIYGDMEGEIRGTLAMGEGKLLIQVDGERVEEIRNEWAAGCAACGIKSAIFHDLRRTALTNMIEAGFPEKEAMEVSGHRTRAVFDRYCIVSSKRSKEIGQRMTEFLQEKEKQSREGQVVQ